MTSTGHAGGTGTYHSAQVGVFKRVCRRCIQSVDFQHSVQNLALFKVNIPVNECCGLPEVVSRLDCRIIVGSEASNMRSGSPNTIAPSLSSSELSISLKAARISESRVRLRVTGVLLKILVSEKGDQQASLFLILHMYISRVRLSWFFRLIYIFRYQVIFAR